MVAKERAIITSVINLKASFFNHLCLLAVKGHYRFSPCPIISPLISSEIHLSALPRYQAVGTRLEETSESHLEELN